MKKLLFIAVFMILASCLALDPHIGMTEQEFEDQIFWSSYVSTLVGAYDDTRVLEAGGLYYYFERGRLNKIDQGQLLEQRIRITIDN